MISRKLRLQIEVEADDAEDFWFLASWAMTKAKELEAAYDAQADQDAT